MIGKIPGFGNSNFEFVISNDVLYFDKTLLIKELLDSKKGVTLFTRPRRFGKTLNLSMIEHFFDITKKQENEKLFENLNIMETEYKDRQGSSPVINISFRRVKFEDKESGIKSLKSTIASLYKKHNYVTEILEKEEKKEYRLIAYKNAEINDLTDSLLNLCEYLYRYHNKRVILLIDEYDTPLISAYTTCTKKLIDFFQNFILML